MSIGFWREIRILLAVAAASAAIFAPLFLRPVSTCLVGGADTRYQARVPPALSERYLDADRMRVGLGAAAVGGWNSLGDAVAVNGEAFLRTTYLGSPNYYGLVHNRYFQSNDFVYVPRDRAEAGTWRIPQGTSAAQLWETLASRYPDGVIAAGYVHFKDLRTIAIARPAIDGRPILRHAASYYTRAMEITPDAWAYVIVAALQPDRPGAKRLLPPGGKSPGYANALRLSGAPVNEVAPPNASDVVAVGQLIGESTAAEGVLTLYPMTHVKDCVEQSPGIARP